MAKVKEIQYPTQEWLDKWVDKYLDKHPNEKIDDFSVLTEKATEAWWDNEVDHDRPTPFDLTEEQKKAQKKLMSTGTRKTPTNYKFDTKKKSKDAEKVEIVQKIFEFVTKFTKNCTISNEGREITFNFGENSYSLVLTKHRTPKKQGFWARPGRFFAKNLKKSVDKYDFQLYNCIIKWKRGKERK